MEKTLNVILVNPGQPAVVTTLPNTLKAAQRAVGGYIECVPVESYGHRALLICDEEGKLKGLAANRRVGHDVITGPFFLCDTDGDGEFASLKDHDLQFWQKEFAQPQEITPQEVEDATYMHVYGFNF